MKQAYVSYSAQLDDPTLSMLCKITHICWFLLVI